MRKRSPWPAPPKKIALTAADALLRGFKRKFSCSISVPSPWGQARTHRRTPCFRLLCPSLSWPARRGLRRRRAADEKAPADANTILVLNLVAVRLEDRLPFRKVSIEIGSDQ